MEQKQQYKMRSPAELKLLQDLRFSKSSYMPWGRQVIRAIDFDDCLKLVHVFETQANLGAQVDVQATDENYGGHAWTHWRHHFVGDTALHFSLRQKKLKCAYMLLALGAKHDIENANKQTAGDIAMQLYQKDMRQMQLDAFREVIPLLPANRLHELPKHSTLTYANFPTVEEEGWKLAMAGRSIYSELPESLYYPHIIPDKKGTPRERPRKWAYRFDNGRQERYRVDLLSGDVEWLGPVEKEREIAAPPPLEDKWVMQFDENGNKYYHNLGTGESQWEMPDTFKSKETLAKEAQAKERAAINEKRVKKGLKPMTDAEFDAEDSDAEYTYKAAGESDSEDEELALQILKEKRLAEEKAKERERDKIKLEKELAALKLAEMKRQRDQDLYKKWKKHAWETGVDESPGGRATSTTGDIWGRNTVTDTIRMLAKQKLRQKRIHEAEAHKASGLTLLNEASRSKTPGLSSQLMKGLAELKGIQKVKFGKYMRLKELARELAVPTDPRGDLDLPYRFITKLSTRTNLKSMIVSDRGITGIAEQLKGDFVMRTLYLHAAGISRKGAEVLASTVVTMTALTNLDLSSNAVCCDGAIAIANAIASEKCPLLRLSLAGNRIKKKGAVEVVKASVSEHCKLIYLSLTNNLIRPPDRDELAAIAGYVYSNQGQQRFYKRDEFEGPTPGMAYRWPFPLNPFSNKRRSWPPFNDWKPIAIRERDAKREKDKRVFIGDRSRSLMETNKMIKEDKISYQPLTLADLPAVPDWYTAFENKKGKISPANKERILSEDYVFSDDEKDEDEDEDDLDYGDNGANGDYHTPKRAWVDATSSPSKKSVTFSAVKYSILQENEAHLFDGDDPEFSDIRPGDIAASNTGGGGVPAEMMIFF